MSYTSNTFGTFYSLNKVNKDNDGKEKDNVVDAEVVDPKEDKEKRA